MTVLGVLATVLFGSMAAYAINMRRTRANRVAARIDSCARHPVPGHGCAAVRDDGEIRIGQSPLGLVVVYMAGAVFCFFIIDGYMSTIPKELVEAAKIDGAGVVRSMHA